MYNKDVSNGFTLNMTTKVALPDVDYINELAVEKNFSLGRSFNTAPKILEDLYYLFKKEQEDPAAFDINNHLFSREYLASDVLFRELNNQENAYYESTLLFFEKIDFGAVIGLTPMDKALNVLMVLAHLSSKTNKKGNEYDEYGDDNTNDPNPGPTQIQDEQQLAQAIKDLGENGVQPAVEGPQGGGANSSGDEDELSGEITRCVRDHLYDLTPSIANIYGAKKPSDVPINRKILADIQIKAYLESSQGLSTNLESKKVKNNDSSEKDKFRMDNYNQINKVKKSAMMMDTFDDKFIKKELNVTERVKPQEKKQILYMLLDDSGSMCCKVKQTYVRAILLNRLESVVDGKSELMFYLYESERYGDREVKDKKAAQQLFKEISLRRPRGGGTYIGHILQQTINEIHNKQGYHDPEIMIVCDGDDHVDPESLDYKDVRINVVLLGTNNPGLEKVAKDTNGFFSCEKLYNRR